MTDEEIIKLCAEAMDIRLATTEAGELAHMCGIPYYHNGMRTIAYDPLHNDAQAMALVKRFKLDIAHWLPDECSGVNVFYFGGKVKAQIETSDADINRAICECVATMQAAK